jgi:hypothetical protein
MRATAGMALSALALPSAAGGAWSWMDPSLPVGSIGAQIHRARYTPSDVANYNIMENVRVTVIVDYAPSNNNNTNNNNAGNNNNGGVTSVLDVEGREAPAYVESGAAVVVPPGPAPAEFSAGPNPAARSAGRVAFFRRGARIISGGTLAVYDASGNTIKKIEIIDNPPIGFDSGLARRVAEWDLRRADGRPVTAGTYLLRGAMKTAGGRQERVSVVLGVR